MKLPKLALILFCLISNSTVLTEQRPWGLAIARLSEGYEAEAKMDLRNSMDVNAQAILERLTNPKGPYRFNFDYSDPIINGFYGYISYVARNPKYSFLAEMLKEFERRNPNKELGELGVLESASFSPGSTYLILSSTYKNFILETNTGKLVKLNEEQITKPDSVEETKIMFYSDDRFVLRYTKLKTCGQNLLSFEDILNKKIVWKQTITGKILTGYSKDYSRVLAYCYFESSNSLALEWDTQTGKVITKRKLGKMDWAAMQNAFINASVGQSGYDQYNYSTAIQSPDNRYKLEGDPTYGVFVLKDLNTNKAIREFRFASGVE